jgi:transcription-repair coupling factor (superfamily II helicase)
MMPIITPSQVYWTQISTLAGHLSDGDEVITLGHLAGASKALFLASLIHRLRRPLLVITSTAPEAELLVHDLRFFTTSAESCTRIVLFPAEEHTPYEPASETSDLTSQRLIALRSMLQADVQIIVTTPQAIVPYVMPRMQLQQAGLDLAPGMMLERQ